MSTKQSEQQMETPKQSSRKNEIRIPASEGPPPYNPNKITWFYEWGRCWIVSDKEGHDLFKRGNFLLKNQGLFA